MSNYAPGSRIVVRDEEWIIRRVDKTSNDRSRLTVIGISELVKDKEAIFLDDIEDEIETISPENTELVKDNSPRYLRTRLYMESLLRQTPPRDDNLYISHQAAIDNNAYQFEPAIQALKQPRQRILLADGVGLGKTIEVGILLSELIKRGKGKRVLVVAIKSMLTQFQKELWARFAIPLVRLDSSGIQRIRSVIPANANPFYYYDKTIISIDTLKQDASYRKYLEDSYWDVIVIDECHNVAVRGKSKSQRARLAQLLASRSDSLILASATPHDGNPETFASLMNMLDPTAIANPKKYTPEEIQGLFIRRFKKDIQGQVEKSFKQRKPAEKIAVATTMEEEEAFHCLTNLEFKRIDQYRRGEHLFRIILEKALFSSPAACIETVENRMKRLRKFDDDATKSDLKLLANFKSTLQKITADKFSKYQKLLFLLNDPGSPLKWNQKDATDRLVIFTERRKTLDFLESNLIKDLGLKKEEIIKFHGGLPDRDQQDIVDEFGKKKSRLKILLASDVASEGINLHYYSHKMIHFDIPWSLMTFQQRNGRIDRYGQEREPIIYYLATNSSHEQIRGDMRILEILINKQERAMDNIGDPAAILGAYDSAQEEKIIGSMIEEGKSEEHVESLIGDIFDDILGSLNSEEVEEQNNENCSLFASDFDFYRQAFQYIHKNDSLSIEIDDKYQLINVEANEAIRYRYKYLPKEIFSKNDIFYLTTNHEMVKEEYHTCRTAEDAWPKNELLWDLHPIAQWINDKLVANIGRHQAPVVFLPQHSSGEIFVVVYGIIPNLKSQPVVAKWLAIAVNKKREAEVHSLEEFIAITNINSNEIPSVEDFTIKEDIGLDIEIAITCAQDEFSRLHREHSKSIKEKLQQQTQRLQELQDKQIEQLEFDFGEDVSKREKDKKENRRHSIDQVFAEHRKWIEETLEIENAPYIKIVAVFMGEN